MHNPLSTKANIEKIVQCHTRYTVHTFHTLNKKPMPNNLHGEEMGNSKHILIAGVSL